MAATGRRVESLDGLRGFSALVVVVHHALLTVPMFAAAYYSATRVADPGEITWAVTYTPLHLGWAGTEAVYVFFILSGVVLTFPVLKAGPFSWIGYYPRRLVRLYVPVFAAVALAATTIFVAPRVADGSLGEWLSTRPAEYTPTAIVRDLVLVGGVSRTVSPLWSLQWEVLFSLGLPLYIYLALKWRHLLTVKLIAVFAVIALGAATSNRFLTFLPMFAIGVLIATEWDRLDAIASRINGSSRRGLIWAATLVASMGALSSFWILEGLEASEFATRMTLPVIVGGATLALCCAAFCGPVKVFLVLAPVRWLGRVSFSLYLVHEPIVIGTRFMFPTAPSIWTISGSILVALVVAELFYRAVEVPSLNWSRKIGKAVQLRKEESAA